MEIDPAALSRTTTTTNAAGTSATPSISTKNLPGSAAKKPAQQSTPRVDLEPLYTSLKGIIADHWSAYKDAISRFVLGYLSQEELARLLDLWVLADPHVVHLHNQLVCAIYANVLRDAPEAAVASWVSANDKPTSVSKPPTGDAAEQRLKGEVMHLPHRMRHRLKAIQDEPQQPLIHSLLSTTYVRNNTASGGPSSSSASPASAGLSKDLEIRKRYTLPLVAEAEDLPVPSALTDRIVPICYEEGLPSGLANPENCTELLSNALETFVKELLTDVVARVRCNPPLSNPQPDAAMLISSNAQVQTQGQKDGKIKYSTDGPSLGITTQNYRRKIAQEEAACARGEIKRSEAGLLPTEQLAAKRIGGGRMAPGDIKIAWEMGGQWLKGSAPWLGETVMQERDFRQDEDVEDDSNLKNGDHRNSIAAGNDDDDRPLTNGVADVNGVNEHHDDDDLLPVDDGNWGWQGASKSDRGLLGSLLDDCLSIE